MKRLLAQGISSSAEGCKLVQEFRSVLFNFRHEDGTVRFWDASSTAMKLIYKMGTAAIFGCDFAAADQSNADGEEEWPPFRKVTVTLLLCAFVLVEILTNHQRKFICRCNCSKMDYISGGNFRSLQR